MPPTFVTLFGTIWLTQSWRVVQHEQNNYLLKVIQDPGKIVQLLQTWETKFFIKPQ